ncbi:MAG: type II toxin-antitoxin system HicB family antitoxin [Chloroflexi bacterium]|nr:type II toxin-antitoxin system HicB family antitoxin [Chloroflexota bacterium]
MSNDKKTKVLEYNAIFTQEEEGGYSVHVPDLPGCYSQGETFEEAKANISEAIELYLEGADEALYHIPEKTRREFMAPVSVRIIE